MSGSVILDQRGEVLRGRGIHERLLVSMRAAHREFWPTALNALDAVFGSTGALLAENDDISAAGNNYCSSVTLALSPGVHYVRVSGWTTGWPTTYYRVAARAGL